jgi:lysophospholipase L1-like esterase
MARLKPDMVVLAFGTNEGFDDNLDPDDYRKTLGSIVQLLQMGNPALKVVMIGPPPGARKEDSCTDVRTACGAAPVNGSCWAQPPNLTAVRDAEREVAAALGAIFWDWSSVLPTACALEEGHLGDPPVFGPDRVHMTPRGYRDSADAFAQVLVPIVANAMRN